MENKKKKPFTSRFTKFEGNVDSLDPDKYEEMVENGLQDSEIAHELNVDERFLKSMKKDIFEDY